MEKITSHPYKFQLIPAGQINVNHLYQRELNNSVVKVIIRNFDYRLVNCVKVVWNHNEWYAFDGQHTMIALRTLFGPDYLVPCLVYEDTDSWFGEAELFERGNTRNSHKPITQIVEWKSRLFRGEKKATEIKNICERYGYKIPTSKGNRGSGYIYALYALEKCYDSMDKTLFDQMLYILSCAWKGNKEAVTSPMLNGMAMFVKTYKDEYNRSDLIKRLSKTDPVLILRAGKASVASGNAKYAKEILNVYNKGTSSGRLPDKLG